MQKEFRVLKVIGQGAFAKVEKVEWAGHPGYYALKSVDRKRVARAGLEHCLLLEQSLLKKLSHPAVVKCHHSFDDQHSTCLVLQFVEGLELAKLLRARTLSEEQRRKTILQLAAALKYLHQQGVVHRDLKPANVLITSLGSVKIIDFGSASILNGGILEDWQLQKINLAKGPPNEEECRTRGATLVGTPNYVSPQLLQQGCCSPAADMWALGCIIYQLYFGKPPFEAQNQYLTFQNIKRQECYFQEEYPSAQTRQLISGLLNKDPKKRLSFRDQLKMRQLLGGADWIKQAESRIPEIDALILVEQDRRVVKKGIVEKKMWLGGYQQRLLVLYASKRLEYFTVEGKMKGTVELHQPTPASATKDCKWQLTGPKKVYYFREINRNAAQEWVQAINMVAGNYC